MELQHTVPCWLNGPASSVPVVAHIALHEDECHQPVAAAGHVSLQQACTGKHHWHQQVSGTPDELERRPAVRNSLQIALSHSLQPCKHQAAHVLAKRGTAAQTQDTWQLVGSAEGWPCAASGQSIGLRGSRYSINSAIKPVHDFRHQQRNRSQHECQMQRAAAPATSCAMEPVLGCSSSSAAPSPRLYRRLTAHSTACRVGCTSTWRQKQTCSGRVPHRGATQGQLFYIKLLSLCFGPTRRQAVVAITVPVQELSAAGATMGSCCPLSTGHPRHNRRLGSVRPLAK